MSQAISGGLVPLAFCAWAAFRYFRVGVKTAGIWLFPAILPLVLVQITPAPPPSTPTILPPATDPGARRPS